jgi:asparagine synthase (glutamine-hydrolysing)
VIIGEWTDRWFNTTYGLAPTTANVEGVFYKTYSTLEIMTNPVKTSEQFFYRRIFEDEYPGRGGLVPYFWMPKYVDATDASARTLTLYDNTEEEWSD